MKFSVRILLLALAATTVTFAQNTPTHIVVIVQENRTPDNLFSALCSTSIGCDPNNPSKFNVVPPQTGGSCHQVQVSPLQDRPLADCADPDHSHMLSWLPTYDGKNGFYMDGACDVPMQWGNCGGTTGCPRKNACPQGVTETDCTQYAYVDNSTGVIQPYLDIATKYGFANLMFQTSQGPSFPAHQFLFSGTSAPSSIINPIYSDFAAENSVGAPNGKGNNEDTGCIASSSVLATLIDPQKVEADCTANPNDPHCKYPCYDHATLTDLLDANNVSWRYYGDQAASIWTAPNAISHICHSTGPDGSCNGAHWIGTPEPDVVVESHNNLAPFLNDLQNCNLHQVTWVIPDGRWSDHAYQNKGLGPDYVADIINAVGGTGPPTNNCGFWNNTVILITWDDWGGWYDHVNPNQPTGPGVGYSNQTGGQYVYGFRVPLLVVSAYVKQQTSLGGYISTSFHDFGSILQFVENNFGISQGIDPPYPYADQFAPDSPNALSDFFCYSNSCKRTFQPISLYASPLCTNTNNCSEDGKAQCDASCFTTWKGDSEEPDDN